jgi:hypothetical protein
MHIFVLYLFTLFIVCIEYNVARMQTKSCRSCPHHMEGLAGLCYVVLLPAVPRDLYNGVCLITRDKSFHFLLPLQDPVLVLAYNADVLSWKTNLRITGLCT